MLETKYSNRMTHFSQKSKTSLAPRQKMTHLYWWTGRDVFICNGEEKKERNKSDIHYYTQCFKFTYHKLFIFHMLQFSLYQRAWQSRARFVQFWVVANVSRIVRWLPGCLLRCSGLLSVCCYCDCWIEVAMYLQCNSTFSAALVTSVLFMYFITSF